MKNKITIIAFGIYILSFSFIASADTQINLQIKTVDKTIYDSSITVVPCDSDNNGTIVETPYCAIQQSGVPSIWDWTWAPGAFVSSIDGIAGSTTKDKDGKDVYHYWSWSLNGSEAVDSLNQHILQPNDTVLLNFIDPVEVIPEPITIEPIIIAPSPSSRGGGMFIAPIIKEKVFSIPDAKNFLEQKQKTDGSFGELLYTDWVAISLASLGSSATRENLIKYLKENDINSSIITDYERHAMALMALGINPYSGTKINYIKKIVDSFDGNQFGDKELDNDDVFALIVLKNAGYNTNDEIILKDINYLISRQAPDGSQGSIDMTAAFIESLRGFDKQSGATDAILKGESYLLSKQEKDDSFGNTSSTSWVLQSMPKDLQVQKAQKYLALKQNIDGGVGDISANIDTRVWATAYTIPAVLNKSWGEILVNFPKEVIISTIIVTPTKEDQIKVTKTIKHMY